MKINLIKYTYIIMSLLWSSSDNDMKEIFWFKEKYTGKHYNFLWGCHGNIIRNTNCYEILKSKKWKIFKIVLVYCFSNNLCVSMLYSGWSNEGKHFFIRIYLSFYLVRGWSFCDLWETDGHGETRQI